MEFFMKFIEFIKIFFAGILSNSVSESFTYIILTLFVLAVVGLFLSIKIRHNALQRFLNLAPNTLTSLGILGTFTGIFIGLLDFNLNDLDKSVGELIGGMKVAFGTSILGLASAVILKILQLIIPTHTDDDDIFAQMFIDGLDRIAKAVEANENTSKEGFDSLKKALSGDDDNSIAGQIQKLRTDIVDLNKTTDQGFEKQIKEFKNFADTMSEAFSDSIIKKLEAVIRDFNEKITEQFGDNFKNLNEAVGKLVEWQENYRQQLEQLQDKFDTSIKAIDKAIAGIEQTESSLQNISTSTASIADSTTSIADSTARSADSTARSADSTTSIANSITSAMEEFNALTETLNQQLKDLHDSLGSVAKMKEKADNAFPTISDKIEKITTTLANTVSDITEKQKEMLDKQNKEIQNHLKESLETQEKTQKEMLDDLRKQFNETITGAMKSLTDSVEKLDEAMGEEMRKAIQEMVNNLLPITRKFVEDYQPLLAETRKIVELAEQAQKSDG